MVTIDDGQIYLTWLNNIPHLRIRQLFYVV
jgi:hypothetical protein